MNKFKKRKLKNKINEHKQKIIIIVIILFVVTLSVGYSALNSIITISGHATISNTTSSCNQNVVGNFTIGSSWQNTESASLYLDSYELESIENFTIEMKVPSGTYIDPIQQCVANTVDNYLYPDANGIITIEFSANQNCQWLSTINAASESEGVITPSAWAGGNGYYFHIHNSIIDGNNLIDPEWITFNGCTIYGSGNNNDAPLTALGLTPSSSTIGIGETLALTTSKTPSYKEVNLSYVSSDPSVATVNSSGVVTGISEGTATITVSAEGISATAQITVEEYVVVPESVTITPNNYRLIVGEIVPLQVSVSPSGANTTYTWTSSDPSVASVNNNGTVTGVSEGTAIITVTTDNNVSSTSTIRVVNQASSNDVDITFELKYEYSYGDNYMFQITIENLTDEQINWFKIGIDLPEGVTYNLWQSNILVDGNTFELITNHYTFIEAGGTFTIQGVATFPESVLEEGQTPWGSPTYVIPSIYLNPEITSIEL